MTEQELQQLIEAGLPGSQVTIGGDGYHFEAIIVSEAFEGVLPVKRQQMVYACLGDSIATGEVHALSMKTLTPKESQ